MNTNNNKKRKYTTKQKALLEAKKRFPDMTLEKLGEKAGYSPCSVHNVVKGNSNLASDLDKIQVQVKYDIVLDKPGISENTLPVCKQVQDLYGKRTEPVQPQATVNIKEQKNYMRIQIDNTMSEKIADKGYYVNFPDTEIEDADVAQGSQNVHDDDDDT
jgi:hypothetical protein